MTTAEETSQYCFTQEKNTYAPSSVKPERVEWPKVGDFDVFSWDMIGKSINLIHPILGVKKPH